MPVPKAGNYVFHVPEYKANGKHYGDVLFPITMQAENAIKNAAQDMGTVVMPTMGPISTLDPSTGGMFSLGEGVTVKIPPGVTTPPPFQKKIEMAMVKVKAADVHANLTAKHNGGKKPKLTYMFVPDEVAFSSPVSFEIAGSGLSAGTKLDIYWVDYKTAKLTLHGEATVTQKNLLVDVKGKGLKLLGWFLFYEK